MMGVRARPAPPNALEQGDEVIIELEDHHARQRRRMLVSFALLVIVGVALYVRLIHLTALGFNSDEAEEVERALSGALTLLQKVSDILDQQSDREAPAVSGLVASVRSLRDSRITQGKG